ncbi:MAG: hypothetical protein JF603_15550 [Acidobacteria bacterium]|nr:hypothetical protein [Acidobacteriota bacterium]
MQTLAELEIWHSRSIAPTRRVALGRASLPVDPAPGFGGLLLGGIVAVHAPDLDPDLAAELGDLLDDLAQGRRIPQPRLRHRFQADRHGLARSAHRLVAGGDLMWLESEGEGSPSSQVLAAAYAAGQLPPATRRAVVTVLRRGLRWRGSPGPALFAHLAAHSGAHRWSRANFADPSGWALGVLGFDEGRPERRDVQRRFRLLLREAHPDHGGESTAAAARIADLSEARRILLAST